MVSKKSRGRRNGNLNPNPDHTAWSHKILRDIRDNRLLSVLQQTIDVSLDDSYIHLHYYRNENSQWDPNEYQDEKVRMQHK